MEFAGKDAIKITGSHSLAVTGDFIEEFKANHSSQVTRNLYLKAMQVVIRSRHRPDLKVGSNFITIDMSGIAIPSSLRQHRQRKSPPLPTPATHNPADPENQDKTHWIEIELVGEDGKPITGEPYKITLPDGKVADGTTGDKGRTRFPASIRASARSRSRTSIKTPGARRSQISDQHAPERFRRALMNGTVGVRLSPGAPAHAGAFLQTHDESPFGKPT